MEILRFNPCCHGLAIAAPFFRFIAVTAQCFNPCCHGLAIAAFPMFGNPHHVLAFQSLLSWISHCGRSLSKEKRDECLVSILVVMD